MAPPTAARFSEVKSGSKAVHYGNRLAMRCHVRVLLDEVWPVLTSHKFRPFMPLWLELATAAACDVEPHLEVVSQIAEGILAWVTSRFKVGVRESQAESAALFLASIEGMYLLEAIGRPDFATSAGVEFASPL